MHVKYIYNEYALNLCCHGWSSQYEQAAGGKPPIRVGHFTINNLTYHHNKPKGCGSGLKA